jgi:hypothetical protein
VALCYCWKLGWCAATVRVPVWCRPALLQLLLSVAWYLGPLLRGVPLLLRLVLWTFPSAPISALVSPSTFHRFRLRCERWNWFSETKLLFAELSSHVDNLRVVSYSLPSRFYFILCNLLVLYLGVIALFSTLNNLMMISGAVRQERDSQRI